MKGSGVSEGQGTRERSPFEHIHRQWSCANNFLVKVTCRHDSHEVKALGERARTQR